MPGHPRQQLRAEACQVLRQRLRAVRRRRLEMGTQIGGRHGTAGAEPVKQLATGHTFSTRLMMPLARARVGASSVGSPTPADAKCGRPPPLPPVETAKAFAISPA